MPARRFDLPDGAVAYRTIGPFDLTTLPKGLLAEHRLKPGTWGELSISEGTLEFVWDDEVGGKERLWAPASFAIPPEVPHHVEVAGTISLTITFHST